MRIIRIRSIDKNKQEPHDKLKYRSQMFVLNWKLGAGLETSDSGAALKLTTVYQVKRPRKP